MASFCCKSVAVCRPENLSPDQGFACRGVKEGGCREGVKTFFIPFSFEGYDESSG